MTSWARYRCMSSTDRATIGEEGKLSAPKRLRFKDSARASPFGVPFGVLLLRRSNEPVVGEEAAWNWKGGSMDDDLRALWFEGFRALAFVAALTGAAPMAARKVKKLKVYIILRKIRICPRANKMVCGQIQVGVGWGTIPSYSLRLSQSLLLL